MILFSFPLTIFGSFCFLYSSLYDHPLSTTILKHSTSHPSTRHRLSFLFRFSDDSRNPLYHQQSPFITESTKSWDLSSLSSRWSFDIESFTHTQSRLFFFWQVYSHIHIFSQYVDTEEGFGSDSLSTEKW